VSTPNPSLVRRLFSGLVVVAVAVTFLAIGGVAATWLTIKSRIEGRVVTVPELFGMQEQEARQALEKLDLVMAIDEERPVHSNLVDEGRILLQVPRQGGEIKAGRVVEVTLSAGATRQLIPDLHGETLSFAGSLLDEVDTSFALVSRIPHAEVTEGRVLAQWPEPGGELGLRNRVSVLVADGAPRDEYVMPSLVGRDYLAVKTFLEEAGLRHVAKYRTEDVDLGQQILDQVPKAGFPVHGNRTITLTVNKDF